MAEYIELGAAINLIRTEGVYGEGHSDEERENDVISMLESLPYADVVEVKHGRWVLGKVEPGYFTPGGNRPWICSECGYLASWMLDSPTYNYCPNCGAKMDGE